MHDVPFSRQPEHGLIGITYRILPGPLPFDAAKQANLQLVV